MEPGLTQIDGDDMSPRRMGGGDVALFVSDSGMERGAGFGN